MDISKIKVLMIGPTKEEPGGITAVVDTFAEGLKDKIELTYLPVCKYGKGSKIIKTFQFFCSIGKFLIIVTRFDIVHIHSSDKLSFWRKAMFLLFSKLFQKKVVFHSHGDLTTFYLNSSFPIKGIIRSLLKISDVVIVLTEKWKIDLEDIIQVKDKAIILANPVDLSLYDQSVKVKKEPNRLLFMGGPLYSNRKGIYDILDAIPSILEDFADAKFIFTGYGDYKRFKEECFNRGCGENISILGYISGKEKIEEFYRSTIFLRPARIEGLGRAIVEAMAAGLPVVVTNTGGIPDIVNDGENGFIVETGDSVMLSDRIRFLLKNPELRREMGKNNIIKVKEKYELSVLSEELLAIYRKLLAFRSRN